MKRDPLLVVCLAFLVATPFSLAGAAIAGGWAGFPMEPVSRQAFAVMVQCWAVGAVAGWLGRLVYVRIRRSQPLGDSANSANCAKLVCDACHERKATQIFECTVEEGPSVVGVLCDECLSKKRQIRIIADALHARKDAPLQSH